MIALIPSSEAKPAFNCSVGGNRDVSRKTVDIDMNHILSGAKTHDGAVSSGKLRVGGCDPNHAAIAGSETYRWCHSDWNPFRIRRPERDGLPRTRRTRRGRPQNRQILCRL